MNLWAEQQGGIMSAKLTLLATALAASVVIGTAACGTDDDGAALTTAETTTTIDAPATTADTTTTTTTMPADTTTTVDQTTTTQVPGLEQPAVWPAPGVDFQTPQAAAENFVAEVLGVPPTLGEFQQGDARSGEIEVLSPGEGTDATPMVRSRLLMRQLGPSNSWFVIGAVSEFVSIEMPQVYAQVPAGSVTVEGLARGFEATVVITAFLAGQVDEQLDQQLAMGGVFETPEPYSVQLDLSGASAGDVVAILVRGDTGLGTDPGEFSLLAVVISG
jgi:hypothetical protein